LSRHIPSNVLFHSLLQILWKTKFIDPLALIAGSLPAMLRRAKCLPCG